MRIVKNYINEAFTQDSDPIKDMGIGVFSIRNFKTEKEIVEWLYTCLPIILGEDKIPKDIIKTENVMFFGNNFRVIDDYVKRYILLNGKHNWFNWGLSNALHYKLLNDGFEKGNYESQAEFKNPYYVESAKKLLNEAFTQDSDPIKDMNIGMAEKLKKFLDTISVSYSMKNPHDRTLVMCRAVERNEYNIVEYLLSLGTKIESGSWDTLAYAGLFRRVEIAKLLIKHGASLDKTYNNGINNYNEETNNGLRWLKEQLDESINEVFTQDSDPIRDMGIGLREILKKKLDYLTHLASEGWSCSMLYDEKFEKYSDSIIYEDHLVEIVRMIYHTLFKIVNKPELTLQEAFEKTYNEEIHKGTISDHRILIRKKVAEILEKEYDVVVDYRFKRKNK